MRAKHAMYFGFILGCLATTWVGAQEPSGTLVTLEKSVHFMSPGGEDVVVAPGRYQVEQQGEGQLRLVSDSNKDALTVKAESATHDEPVTGPVALSVQADEEDIHHLVLLLQGGKSLDAVGSYSGIRSRQALFYPQPLSPQQVAAMRQRPSSAQVGTGLSLNRIYGPAPGNVTVTATSPTTVRVEWSPLPDALRYVISRNGAPDILIEGNSLLQGNRYIYTDTGRKPAMLHTYTVAAQFTPPLLTGRSAPTQVLTPPLLPPQNFKGAITGQTGVTLSWIARPEATSYRIIRSGGNLPATVLNVASGTSYVDQNLSPGEFIYTILSVIRLPSGEELFGEYSSPVILKTRPFNIVAIGDSVMWGQGLRPENKFAAKVRDWLQGSLGKPVNLYFDGLAHSGAITYPDLGDLSKEGTILPGEVPTDTPSIAYQAKTLAPGKVSPQDVDLVLVNGCINNLNVATILNPFGDDSKLRDDTMMYCHDGMYNVLTDVASTFVNAIIVVTGYYPLVSGKSSFGALVPLIAAIIPEPLTASITTLLYREKISERSEIFLQTATSSLESVVNTLTLVPPPLGGLRYILVKPPFGPDNAYGASNTWLWFIPVSFFPRDEVFDTRVRDCQPLPYIAKNKCMIASMGHPNNQGAQAYASAIISDLSPFIPQWHNNHRATTAPEGTFTIDIRQGQREIDGAWLTIIATDTISGSPLQGRILMNGRPVGSLGTQIRYKFNEINPTDIVVKVDVPTHRARSFIIPIRTLTVSVNLISGGAPRTAIVAVADAVSGEVRNGTVTVNPNSPQQAIGNTGQQLTYPSCGEVAKAETISRRTLSQGPAPCVGTVHVSYYPDISFYDVPGAVRILKIERP